jgi:hypothetical protein
MGLSSTQRIVKGIRNDAVVKRRRAGSYHKVTKCSSTKGRLLVENQDQNPKEGKWWEVLAVLKEMWDSEAENGV